MSKQLTASSNVISKLFDNANLSKLHLHQIFMKKAVHLVSSQGDMLESQTFYAVLQEYYKNLLDDTKFAIVKDLLKDFFKIEKDVKIKKQETNTKEFDAECSDVTTEQKNCIKTLIDMANWTNSVILVGPPHSGKSTIIKKAAKIFSIETEHGG